MTRRFPLALHTWTIDTTPLAEALASARDGGFDAVELRRTDFIRCFERGLSNGQVLDLVEEAGIPVCTLGVEYGWLFADGEERRRLFDVFRESCRNAVALRCPLLMSAPGPLSGPIGTAVERLKEAGDIAGESGLRLAIEFNSQHEVLNRLEVQQDLILRADRPNCGALLDAYHLARSGRPGRGFAEVSGALILAFQYSDLSRTPVTGVKRPTDRLLPGTGVVLWTEVFRLLAEKGFSGPISYEAPNPAIWAQPPLQACREGVAATEALLEAAFR